MRVRYKLSKLLTIFVFSIGYFSLLVSIAPDSQAQSLYGYRDAQGNITFTSRRPRGRKYWRVKRQQPSRSRLIRHKGNNNRRGLRGVTSDYDGLIQSIAREYDLDPALVKAVVHVESSFNRKARSPKGATGLMQLMPATAKRFSVKNIHDPRENLTGGMRYLQWLSRRFNGNMRYTLAAYNAGEAAVDRYRGVPPYRETQNYVQKVLRLRKIYRCDYAGRTQC